MLAVFDNASRCQIMNGLSRAVDMMPSVLPPLLFPARLLPADTITKAVHMRRFLLAAFTLASLAGLPRGAQAATITGELDFSGGVTVTPTTIVWVNPLAVTSTSTLHNGAVGPINTGTDTSLNLDSTIQVPGTNFTLDRFETLSAAPTIDFVLNTVLTCGQITAGGGSGLCSAGLTSPFVFSQGPTGTTVTLDMSGVVFDTTTPTLRNPWLGIYTAQFPGMTIDQVLMTASGPGGISTSFSGSKVATVAAVPDSGSTITLLGAALLGLSLVRRKFAKD